MPQAIINSYILTAVVPCGPPSPIFGGSGGGTTFECYAEGDYTASSFAVEGVNITAIDHGNGSFGFLNGMDFESEAEGTYVDKTFGMETGLLQSYSGDGP